MLRIHTHASPINKRSDSWNVYSKGKAATLHQIHEFEVTQFLKHLSEYIYIIQSALKATVTPHYMGLSKTSSTAVLEESKLESSRWKGRCIDSRHKSIKKAARNRVQYNSTKCYCQLPGLHWSVGPDNHYNEWAQPQTHLQCAHVTFLQKAFRNLFIDEISV